MADHLALSALRQKIFIIRGRQVMRDVDLAVLYGVETGQINRAVRRNLSRFPADFMFQVTEIEEECLRCQFGISNANSVKRGGRRYRPYLFTELGVAMLSSVLKSENAILVNIEIMRAFVEVRAILLSNHDLVHRFNQLEKKYDSQFKIVFDAIRQLLQVPDVDSKKIGIIKSHSEEF